MPAAFSTACSMAVTVALAGCFRQTVNRLLEALPVFGTVDGVRAGADDRRPRLPARASFSGSGRRTAHDHALRLSMRTISSTSSSVTGSKYRRSEVS